MKPGLNWSFSESRVCDVLIVFVLFRTAGEGCLFAFARTRSRQGTSFEQTLEKAMTCIEAHRDGECFRYFEFPCWQKDDLQPSKVPFK